MKLRIEEYNSDKENAVLTYMVVSNDVLSRIIPVWSKECFKNKTVNKIARWCIEHYEQYGEAPKSNIERIFRDKARKMAKEESEMLEAYLRSLNNNYLPPPDLNIDFAVDQAKSHFKEVAIKKLNESVATDLENKDYVKASERLSSFSLESEDASPFIDVLQDVDAMRSCLEYSKADPVVEYTEGLGDLFGGDFCKNAFVIFTGSDKAGKSFMLHDVIYRAACQRRRALYFEAGDMTRDQAMERFMIRMCGRPIHAGEIDYPTDIFISNDNGKPEGRVVTEKRIYEKSLTWRDLVERANYTCEKRIKSFDSYWKLGCFPTSTLKVEEIRSQVRSLTRQGWPPEIVVIDYADILAAPSWLREEREQIVHIHKKLRALSQEFPICLVTAAQGNAEAYNAPFLKKKHFSGSKAKNAYCTAMYGINTTEDDRKQGIIRINCMLRRRGRFLESRCCYAASCLDIANPAVHSVF
jgi:replicative DNA helicase